MFEIMLQFINFDKIWHDLTEDQKQFYITHGFSKKRYIKLLSLTMKKMVNRTQDNTKILVDTTQAGSGVAQAPLTLLECYQRYNNNADRCNTLHILQNQTKGDL